jgi:uncharacterized membrane protein
MTTKNIVVNDGQATYFISDAILISSEQDALDIMGEAELGGIILHDYNFEKDFFDLSTRKLGDVLQKFTNYRMRLAIIGDFSKYPSKILPNFIAESNRHKKYIFVSSLDEVNNMWG